ncbi:hypothetical protein BJX70DRAFT_403043 [Aspergillus crustosus]
MADSCGFPGNSDLYGLGIRIGIYLQWISALVSSYFHLDDTDILRFNYFAFSLAVMAAVFVLTVQGTAHTIEIIIMIYMFFGGLYTIAPRTLRGRQQPRLSKRMILGPVTGFTMLIYSAWFWTTGRKSDRFIPTPCGNTLFLFARIPPRHFGRVSGFFAALSVFVAIAVFVASLRYYYPHIAYWIHRYVDTDEKLTPTDKGALLECLNQALLQDIHQLLHARYDLPSSAVATARAVSIKKTYILFSVGSSIRPYCIHFEPPVRRYAELAERVTQMSRIEQGMDAGIDSNDLSAAQRVRASWKHFRQGILDLRFLVTCNSTREAPSWAERMYILEIIIPPLSCIYSILATELMLQWNQVSDIYTVGSTGQLIPVIVSAVGMLDIVLNIRNKYEQRRQETEWADEIAAANVHSERATSQEITNPE